MIKIAILDDYQNAFRQIIDLEKYKDIYNFKVFNNPFKNEEEAIIELEDSPYSILRNETNSVI